MADVFIFGKGVDATRLTREIKDETGITKVLTGVTARSGLATIDATITFDANLSVGEETLLSGIVSSHIPSRVFRPKPMNVTTVNGLSGNITLNISEDALVTPLQINDASGILNIQTAIPTASGQLISALQEILVSVQASGVVGPSGVAGPAGPAGSGLFGIDLQETEDDNETSSNSTAFQQKLRLTTSSLDAGKYRIGWSFEWRGSKTDKKGQEFRVHLDDATTLMYVDPRMNSKMNKHYSQWGGFKYITLTTGVHTIDLDYRALASDTGHNSSPTSSSENTVTVRRARLEIWRVS